jgi:hypothetical protein
MGAGRVLGVWKKSDLSSFEAEFADPTTDCRFKWN